MKHEYEKPEITISLFTTEDIITVSTPGNNPMSIEEDYVNKIDGSIFE